MRSAKLQVDRHREISNSIGIRMCQTPSRYPYQYISWYTLIVRNQPRPGGFLCWVVSKRITRVKRTPHENNPIFPQELRLFFRGCPVCLGSWLGNHPTKIPPGGRVSYNSIPLVMPYISVCLFTWRSGGALYREPAVRDSGYLCNSGEYLFWNLFYYYSFTKHPSPHVSRKQHAGTLRELFAFESCFVERNCRKNKKSTKEWKQERKQTKQKKMETMKKISKMVKAKNTKKGEEGCSMHRHKGV